MVTDPDDPSHFHDDEEPRGGPIKPFLEHLEDLRWTLIKCVSAVLVAMIVCLVASNYIVTVLQYPLHAAAKMKLGDKPLVTLHVGDKFTSFSPATNDVLWMGLIGTNKYTDFHLEPVPQGTNLQLALVAHHSEKAPNPSLVTLKSLGPMSGFSIMIKVAIFGGLGLASPFLFYFIAQFVLPALHYREKDFLLKGVGFGTLLFIGGVAFCYFIIMKVTLVAAVQVSEFFKIQADEWRAEEYISFVFKFMIGMGLGFQLPVVILTIVKVGLLDYKKLSQFRMYWVVVNLVLSAVITPSGDPLTMVLFALPLHVLYEISILIAWIWARRDARKLANAS